MTKDQFLHELTVQLNLNVSDQAIRRELQYYDRYISDRMLKGEKEEDIISSLQSPRILAKTIIEACEACGDTVAMQDEEIRGTIDTEPDTSAFDDYHTEDNPYSSPESAFMGDELKEQGEDKDPEERSGYDSTQLYEDENKEKDSGFGEKIRFFQMKPHVLQGPGCLIALIVLFLILNLFIYLLGGIFILLSPVLLPGLVVIVLIWMVMGALQK